MANIDQKTGVVILGGDFSSLGVARNLSMHNVPVYIVDSELCIARYSRHVKGFFKSPFCCNDAQFVDFLIRIASDFGLGGSVLFASEDEHVRILSQYTDPLRMHYRLSIAPWEIIEKLYDKRQTYHFAVQKGIPVPVTFNVADKKDLDLLEFEFPVVLKPAITPHLMSVTHKKAYLANNRHELVEHFQMISTIIGSSEILIQEFIPGGTKNLFSYFGYFKEGRPVSGFACRRLRQHPMDFGRASTFVVSASIPELEHLATQLFSGTDFFGLAEVEFMFDPKHNRFEILEVNPRIWGWHMLAVYAGVNLPYIAYADILGEFVPCGSYQEGVKWMRLLTDIPTVMGEIWLRRMSLGDYLQSVHGAVDAVFSLTDPLPFIVELLALPFFYFTKGF